MTYVIFHGSYGNPQENWFPELKEKLEALGQHVIIPAFPTPVGQNLNSWLKVFENVEKELKGKKDLCFIGHSLGPLFILHAVSKFNIKLDSAIFVSPFLDKLNNQKFDKINSTFYKNNLDFEKLKKLIPVSYTLFSNNDPYVPASCLINFAKKLNSQFIEVKGGKHLNSEAGIVDFPLVFELCKTRINLTSFKNNKLENQPLKI
ncbi:MAG: alpha/beta hydrolase [Candidatus Levyibacteriota bacterium]